MTSPVNFTDKRDTNKGSLHKDLTDPSEGFSVLNQFEIDTQIVSTSASTVVSEWPSETKTGIARMQYKTEEDKAHLINTIVKLTLSDKMVNPGEKRLT